VNGGRNYNGPKVKPIGASLSKTKLYAGNPSKVFKYSSFQYVRHNLKGHGGNPQERLIVEN